MMRSTIVRCLLLAIVLLCAGSAGAAIQAVEDSCGPFTDVSPLLCPFVLETYYTGITAGTSPTTFSPDMQLTRGQAAVFVAGGLNQALARSSRRASLGRWWTTTPQFNLGLGVLSASAYGQPASDGADIWVVGTSGVQRIQGSSGRVLETWNHFGSVLLAAAGRVFTYFGNQLYMLDPSQPPGVAVPVANFPGGTPESAAFDGARIWIAIGGGVSIVTPGPTLPWTVTSVTTGFKEASGLVFDGQSMWVTDAAAASLYRLDTAGKILQTVSTGDGPGIPLFDGRNIWVPNCCLIEVVQASTGRVVSFANDGLPSPVRAAFDGRRILVLSRNPDSVSLWDAATLVSSGPRSLGTGAAPQGICSDGIDFWITLGDGRIARY